MSHFHLLHPLIKGANGKAGSRSGEDSTPGYKAKHLYFLITWSHLLGAPTNLSHVCSDAKQLAKQLRLSRGVVNEGLKYWVKRKVVREDRVPSQRGAPKKQWVLECDELAKLIGARQGAVSHLDLLMHLLTPIQGKIPLEHFKLKIPARVLLLVLLSRSDGGGVVRDVGQSAICTSSGIAKDSLSAQIENLKKVGLLRRVIPGFTSPLIFGTAHSVYYLNLRHPIFGNLEGGLSILYLNQYHDQFLDFKEVEGLANICRYSGIRSTRPLLCSPCVRDFFGGFRALDQRKVDMQIVRLLEDKNVVPYLQAKLEQFTSVLLTAQCCEFSLSNLLYKEEGDPDIYETVRQDLFPDRIMAKQPESWRKCSEQFCKLMAEFVAWIAHTTKALIKQVCSDLPKNCCFLILPADKYTYEVAVTIKKTGQEKLRKIEGFFLQMEVYAADSVWTANPKYRIVKKTRDNSLIQFEGAESLHLDRSNATPEIVYTPIEGWPPKPEQDSPVTGSA